jgi:hypothetical protein
LQEATPEARRKVAIALNEYFMILGKGLTTQPRSAIRDMYAALLIMVRNDERKFGRNVDYYFPPNIFSQLKIAE